MLADAACKDDGVHAAHGGNVAADGHFDLVVQHIAGQLCAHVAMLGGFLDVALVAGNAGNTQQTGLLVQDLVQLVAGDFQVVFQVVDHAGVQVAAAGAHHQAGQRGHAHGGVDDLALVDSGNGGTVAQVAGDEFQALNGLLQKLGGAVADILVAGAVEAVAAHAVLLVVLVGDGVHVGLRGHGGVEGRIKHSDVGLILAKDLIGSLDTQDGGGVMQGSQGAQVMDSLDDLGGDQAALLKLLAAVNNTVADGVDLGNAVNNFALAGGHLLHDLGKCLGVGGEDGGRGGLVAVALVGDHAAFHTDALAQTFAKNLFSVHVDELVLQAGRAAVDNQNFHGVSSLFLRAQLHPFLITIFII